jgi:hypothetical protein
MRQVLATGHGNAIAGDAVYSPHCYEALVRRQQQQTREKNPEDPSLIHSPHLALQVTRSLTHSWVTDCNERH